LLNLYSLAHYDALGDYIVEHIQVI